MPTYEYRCKDCGHEIEIVQSFSDDALEICPECEGSLKKVYGNVGISFKGSGFYKTDSRGSSKKSSGSSSSSSSSDGGSSSSDSSSSTSTDSSKSDSKSSSSSSDSSSKSKATTSTTTKSD